MVEKDAKIEQQRAEITNLRKKNFEFRSKNQELQDSIKQGASKEKKEAKEKSSHMIEDIHSKMVAIHMQA